MRTIIYTIYKKGTNERVYSNARQIKCEEILATLENKEQYEIRYQWRSF
jgi:hypothetical protein